MKQLYFLFFIFFVQIQSSIAQYTAIPDLNFEQELISQGIDTNQTPDNQVLTSAISGIISLTINSPIGANIINLSGIESFTALEELNFFSAGSLQTINVSQNQYLKKIALINAQITNLNISNNLNLETLYLYYTNQLSSIILTNNINLKDLRIGNFNIPQIDLTNNTNLEKLLIRNTQISQLDLTHNTTLKYIYLYYNFFTNINLSQNILLEELSIQSTPISSINVLQNLALKKLDIEYTPIQNIDVSNNNFLEALYCSNNSITSLNLNNNLLLNVLYCKNLATGGSPITNFTVQNGSNSLLNGVYDVTLGSNSPVYVNRFDSTNNPNLHCIFVDNVTNCNTNWLGKDATSNYVTTQAECDNLQNEEFVANSFSVYPNPVNDILNIESTNNNVIQKIIVYDLMGKAILEQKGENTQLNLSNITSGLYLVKIITENESIVKKIVKK